MRIDKIKHKYDISGGIFANMNLEYLTAYHYFSWFALITK